MDLFWELPQSEVDELRAEAQAAEQEQVAAFGAPAPQPARAPEQAPPPEIARAPTPAPAFPPIQAQAPQLPFDPVGQFFMEAPPGPGQFLGDPNEVIVFEPEVPVHLSGGFPASHPAYQIMLGMVNNVGMFINNVLGMEVNRPAQPPGIRVDGRSMFECEVCARLFTSRITSVAIEILNITLLIDSIFYVHNSFDSGD